MKNPSPAKIKSVVTSLAARSAELERALHGTATDAVNGWINSQYLSTAQASLAAAADQSERFDISRRLARDWAVLRRSDQRAERLRIDRIRVRLVKRDIDTRREEKTDLGISEIFRILRENPNHNPYARETLEAMRKYWSHKDDSIDDPKYLEWLDKKEARYEAVIRLLRGVSRETYMKVCAELGLCR